MTTYTFHHYAGDAPAGITFGDFASDEAALEEARRLLERNGFTCVEVCDLRREVGVVRRLNGGIEVLRAS